MALSDADKLLNAASSKMRLAVVRTLNRTADSVRSKARSEIAKDLGLRNRDVTPALLVLKARGGDPKPTAWVVASGKRIPLIAFSARQVRRGVSYRIGSQGKKTLQSGFIARMRSGHLGVFMRRGRKRLPIDERLGPSIPKSFISRRVQTALKAVIDSRLVKEMEANVRYYAGKIGIGVN